jgi:hypothetical protein
MKVRSFTALSREIIVFFCPGLHLSYCITIVELLLLELHVYASSHMSPSFFRSSFATSRLLRPNDAPLDRCNTDLLARLLVIVEPLPIGQVDARKLRSALRALGQPFAVGFELYEFQTATVEL